MVLFFQFCFINAHKKTVREMLVLFILTIVSGANKENSKISNNYKSLKQKQSKHMLRKYFDTADVEPSNLGLQGLNKELRYVSFNYTRL